MAGNGQSDLDKLVGAQPEDVRRKFYPGEYEGRLDDDKTEAHRSTQQEKAVETIKPFKLGGK